MTHLDLSGSFLIGGVLLVALMGLFYYNANFSQSKTVNEISITSAINVKEILDHDLHKIGYRYGNNPIKYIDSSNLKFVSDLKNDGSCDTIWYSMDNGLKRIVLPENNSFTMPIVKNITILGYDSTDTETTIPSLVESIKLSVTFDNSEMLTDSTFFSTSYFE